MSNGPSFDVKYPFGPPEAPQPPDPAPEEEDILDALDYGAIEQDIFLLRAHLLNTD